MAFSTSTTTTGTYTLKYEHNPTIKPTTPYSYIPRAYRDFFDAIPPKELIQQIHLAAKPDRGGKRDPGPPKKHTTPKQIRLMGSTFLKPHTPLAMDGEIMTREWPEFR